MRAADHPDARTAGIAAVAGGAAFLLGYLLTYVTQRGAVTERIEAFNVLAGLLGGDPIPPWKAVGWLFYNAHLVATELPGIGGTRTMNFIAESDGGLVVFLYLLPPVLLLVAGAAVATLTSAETPTAGAVAGVLLPLGYLPVALSGAVAVAYPVGDGRIGPDLVAAVALAGVLAPAVFGALGGGLRGLVADRD